jgi:hypothetical protein
VRFLGVATVVGALLCASVLGYGLLRGPTAPIRHVQGEYRDKYGNRYTAEDHARFIAWERVLVASFAATFLAGFAWAGLGRKQRRRGQLSSQERATLDSTLNQIERVLPDVAHQLRKRGPR